MGEEVNNEQKPQKENINDVINKYKDAAGNQEPATPTATPTGIPSPSSAYSPENFEATMSQETDPDLMMSYEIIKLPSKGLFYPHKISEVNVEYMTSRDEDLLTTPSLIESGNVLDLLLKRKVKTKGFKIEDLLAGDRNAIILFLRTSSYGADYAVQVIDPRDGKSFKTVIDLTKLKYKEVSELPDENGYFSVELPMRKKVVKFKLLTSGEDTMLLKKADAMKEAYNQEVSEYNTLKLKAHIASIGDKSNNDYIAKFVDAMPALDAFTIRRKILDVSPDVDMSYEFTAKDGYKFTTDLTIGIDFFFPKHLAGEYKKMVDEEIFVLTKHANFQAEYIENIPIYRRRHYLFLLQKENEEIEKMQDQSKNNSNFRPR